MGIFHKLTAGRLQKENTQTEERGKGMADNRVISLKGVLNIRDFGGIETADGRKILPHMFLRSSLLEGLTHEDMAILKTQYDLTSVIDLRTDQEAEEKPDPNISGVTHYQISLLEGSLGGISHEKETKLKLEELDLDMPKLYRSIVSDPYSIAQLRKVFGLIIENVLCENNAGSNDFGENGAVLWHCTGGKDRCGIVSALWLYILGADKKTIFMDYLMTNQSAITFAKKRYWAVLLLKRDKELAMKIYRMCVADKHYLMAAFDEIHRKFGSIDRYVEEQLGIMPLVREAVKDRVLF